MPYLDETLPVRTCNAAPVRKLVFAFVDRKQPRLPVCKKFEYMMRRSNKEHAIAPNNHNVVFIGA